MKRKGETLTEFLVATVVFGIIITGLFEFVANQTETLADMRNKDDLMYYAQRLLATGEEEIDGVKCKKSSDEKTLTVTLANGASMTFSLQP